MKDVEKYIKNILSNSDIEYEIFNDNSFVQYFFNGIYYCIGYYSHINKIEIYSYTLKTLINDLNLSESEIIRIILDIFINKYGFNDLDVF